MSIPPILILGAFATVVILVIRSWMRSCNRQPLPPGPPGYPIIGNVLDIPSEYENVRFTEWSKTYGDVVHVKAFSQPLIILNTRQAAIDLLEKRSSNYSDRPAGVMLTELMRSGWMFPFMKYGATWRKHRKVFHMGMHPQAARQYARVQERRTLFFLKQILKDPNVNIKKVVHSYVSSIILGVIYGYRLEREDDPLNMLCEQVTRILTDNMGKTFLVDSIPILKHIPSWFPFAKFKRNAEKWRTSIMDMRDRPFEYTQASTTQEQCVVSEHITRLKGLPLNEMKEEMQVIRDCAGVGYMAGFDTTTACLRAFYLAMILHPEIQKRGQFEVDSVLGEAGTRLPTFEDKGELPFVHAILQEVLRWHPPVPVGIPHRSINDDVYNGQFIPGGSIIFGNIGAILSDEAEYPNPEVFNPDRFVPQDGRPMPMDPISVAFGFGRRICAGRYLALDTMWIAIASMLSMFDVLPALEADEKTPIMPSIQRLPGTVSHHKDFPCRLVPRSKRVVELLSNAEL